MNSLSLYHGHREEACLDFNKVELVVDYCLNVLVGSCCLLKVLLGTDGVDNTLLVKSFNLVLKR